MDDEISSGEGAQPPNEQKPRSAARRSRRLSGPANRALGELAFALYEVAAAELPSDRKWNMLRAKLLAWRGVYL